MHWNGCLYFLLSQKIGLDTNAWVFNTTSHRANEFAGQYISCLFWSIHMLTTIGEVKEPTTTFETYIVIIVFFVAIFLIATLVGNIGSVITNMNLQQSNFQSKLDAIKSVMAFRKVSKELDMRVIKWFDYLHKNNQILDEKEVLANLPDKLRIEIASYIHLQTLKNVNIFSECEEGLLKDLVTKLKNQVYSPGDFVCKKGDIGKEMFIIKKGSLNVVSDDGQTVFVTLKAGSFFGELSILNIPGIKTGNRRTANVQSVGYSDLLRLTKSDLWDVLQEYTTDRKAIIQKGFDKLLKDKLLDEKYAEKIEVAKLEGTDFHLDEMDFDSLRPEVKLERLEALYESIEKRIDAFMHEFDNDCNSIDSKLHALQEKYAAKFGINV